MTMTPIPEPLRFEAIGTRWNIQSFQPVAPATWQRVVRAIRERIEDFDRHYSRFRADSLVTKMAGAAGSYRLPADARQLLDLYRRFYDLTDGAMTPLIGRALSDAGYDAAYSLAPRSLTSPPAWESVMDYQFPNLNLYRPALLDFGAAGKGYLVDLVAGLLRAAGIESYFVDAGGDMAYRREAGRPLEVGLEHPADPSQAIGVAHLAAGSLCGSAGNRRSWGTYHHILDPRTLASPSHILAVWAIAGSTILADALTTALYLVPAAAVAPAGDFEYAIMYEDYSLEHSPSFPATFFSAG